jgi:two-component system sporulation sensor kinase A
MDYNELTMPNEMLPSDGRREGRPSDAPGDIDAFRQAFDHSPIGMVVADLGGRMLLVNEAFCEFLGYSCDEMPGHTIQDVTHPDDLAVNLEMNRRLVAGEIDTHRIEKRYLHKDGSVVNGILTVVLLRDAAGRPAHYLAQVQDVTELHRALDQASESNERFRSIFDRVNDGIVLQNLPGGEILEVNETMCRMYGYTRNEILGLDVGSLSAGVDGFSNQGALDLMARAAAGESCIAEWLAKRKDGTLFWVEVSLGRADIHNHPRLLVVVRDISARKAAEEAWRSLQANLNAARRVELIGSLACGVAHEVRNPLNAILALTDALEPDLQHSPEDRTILGHLRDQVDRLSRLMNDLLELGKPVERARMTIEPLDELVNAALDAWRHAPAGRGRRVIKGFAGGEWYVLADASRLQQVIINLLDNAAQHSPTESVIAVGLGPAGPGEVELRVTDRGSGVPEDRIEKVFEPFFTSRHTGTGLGLSIVRSTVESHRGRIVLVNNEDGPGCTVRVILPLSEGRP